MSWDPKVGFRIPLGPHMSYSYITCATSVNGTKVTSEFILQRLSKCFLMSMFSNIQWSNLDIEPTSVFVTFKVQQYTFMSWLHFVLCVATVLKNVRITLKQSRVLVGNTLNLICLAETTYNGRIHFDWKFQQKPVSSWDWESLCLAYNIKLVFVKYKFTRLGNQ